MNILRIGQWSVARKFVVLMAFVAIAMVVADAAWAQEAASGVTAHKKSWFELFRATGVVGILLLLLSIGGFALVIEHIVNLREDKIMPPDLIGQLDEALDQGDTEKAYEICQARDCPLSRVVKAGLEAGGTGEVAMEAAREASVEEAFSLNTKISYLSLVGNIGPLMGLLGTVTGMITSFQEIERKKAPTPADLATGVYESLVNTTMGLFAAIIFLTAYFIFKNKVAKMLLSGTNTAMLLLRDRAAAA
jgi:biopolymer transport protein ExbB